MANAPGFSRSNPQYDMTIKQQIKHGAIQKLRHLHNSIFCPIQLCHTLSILLYFFPPLFTKFH